MNLALLSSKKMDYCTPQTFFEKLDAEFHFQLDAAASAENAKCERYYTAETDGLESSWNVGGAVFCNPPYGRDVGKWVRKAYMESRRGVTSVLLIPARTDTYLTTPQKDYAVIVQSIGRVARTFEGKQQPVAYDYVDTIHLLVKAYKQRCTHYRKCGCTIKECI